jgi:hypothetical protein
MIETYLHFSGLDGTLPRSLSKATNSKFSITKGVNSTSRPDYYLHPHTSRGVPGRAETALVSL